MSHNYNYGDYDNYDYEDGYYANYATQATSEARPNYSNPQQTINNSTATATQEKDIDWDAEAKLPYKTVVISARKKFLPTQVIKGDLDKPETWSLKNDGRVFLSLTNGDLVLESGDKNDFREIMRILEENRKDLECHSKNQKGKKERSKISNIPKDLLKELRIYDVTSNCGIGTELVMEFHNIPAFNNEITRSANGNVTRTFLPGTLSATVPSEHKILNRSINNLSVAFQKKFPGVTISNVEKTIANLNNGTHCLVPADGPIAFFHNRDLPESEQIRTTIKAAGLEQIEMTRAQKDASVAIVKEKIGKNISSANITGDTRISIYMPPTQDRIIEDFEFKAERKDALPFLSFADAFHALPDGSTKDHSNYLKSYKWINFMLEMTYCPDQL